MLDTYKVAFFGDEHIEHTEEIMKLLEKHIRNLIDEHWYVELFVGNNGDFNKCVTTVLDKIHREYDGCNSSLVLYLPLFNSEYVENKDQLDKLYNDICICSFDADADMKSAIKKRNFKMVDDADLIVYRVRQKDSAAYRAVQYAVLQEKPIINLADL